MDTRNSSTPADAGRSHARRALFTALILLMALLLWLASGHIYRASDSEPEYTSERESSPLQVETRLLQAQPFSAEILLQGQLQPLRSVHLRSQITAPLRELPHAEGDRVEAGTLLARLDEENRPAQLARAEAELRSRQAEARAGERLYANKHISEADYLRLQAAVAAARAERDQMQLQLQHTELHAPFAGVINALPLEVGDLVQTHDPLVHLVDISTLKLQAHAPQTQARLLDPSLPASALLLNGETLDGAISFVATVADANTRSFRVEALIENPQLKRLAGGSATLRIRLPQQPAHYLSPALLALDEDGRTGIHVVDASERVAFIPVQLLSLDTEGVWVGGAPEEIRLITQGAGFARVGETVVSIAAEAE